MKIRIPTLKNEQDVLRSIKSIGVCPQSIKFLKPKAFYLAVKLEKLNAAACNIIKQEMLSLGADAAVAKDVITGKIKYSDCLLFGNISQLNKLSVKLRRQPLGLREIADEIKTAIANYRKSNYTLECGRHKLYPGKKIYLMAVLNVTPDSFSDGNQYFKPRAAIERGLELAAAGADIIDIGGESTRPQARTVSFQEQVDRVIPVIRALRKKIKQPISIDTRNSRVAQAALEAGASIINDVSGLKNDKRIAKVAARYRAGLIITHSKGTPLIMQKNPVYKSVIADIMDGLNESIALALKHKVNPGQIVIDPGIGFGKTTKHNLEIIKRLAELKVLGYPILIGASRKSFIGNVLNLPVEKRLAGTIATVVYSILEGAGIVRAHDVEEVSQAIKISRAITGNRTINVR